MFPAPASVPVTMVGTIQINAVALSPLYVV